MSWSLLNVLYLSSPQSDGACAETETPSGYYLTQPEWTPIMVATDIDFSIYIYILSCNGVDLGGFTDEQMIKFLVPGK